MNENPQIPVTGKWKRYPSYKQSGVEWLGEVPDGWELTNLGHRTNLIVPMRDKPPEFEGTIPWIRIEDFSGKYISDSKSCQYVSEKIVGDMNLKIFPAGTVLCSCSCSMGATAIVGRPLISNQTFIGIVPKIELDSNFLYYLMGASGSHLQMLGSGAVQQYLSRENFSKLKFAFPHFQEQQSIATFLDCETARIDALIEKKERLIALLEEKRGALISHSVTKGLDPDVKMKDSGVEWIGEVPEGWKVTKLARITVRIGDGLHGTPEYVDDSPYRFINGNNLSNGFIKMTSSARCVNSVEFEKYKISLDESSLLMSINGTIGSLALYRGESIILGKSVAYINCEKTLSRIYLSFLLQSSLVENTFRRELTGTTIFNLSLESIRNLPVTLPPLMEQQEISSFLSTRVAKFQMIIDLVNRDIDFLLEYRSALISAAVTGKIDVRQEASV